MNYTVPIRLNNKGAHLISEGKIEEARVIIVKALNLTKHTTIENRKAQRKEQTKCKEGVTFIWLSQANVDAPPNSFVYQRPVQILENPAQAECRSLAGDFSAAIVFNLSLCFHLGGYTCSRMLEKAISGYKIALDLRKTRRRTRCIPLDLALLNNMAHAYSEVADYAKAAGFVRNLTLLLRKLPKGTLEDDDSRSFRMGAMWRQPSCAPMA